MLILDENMTHRWVAFFETESLEAKHWNQIGKQGDSDKQTFEYARDGHHVTITQDLDFGRLLAEHKSALPSVIQMRVNIPTPRQKSKGKR